MAGESGPIVVLVSSDFEWRILKDIIPVTGESKTPFGEQFVAQIGQQELWFFHGGWGKIAAAASCQYAVRNRQS
jgi:adenosylhomocysteine nucleosidase